MKYDFESYFPLPAKILRNHQVAVVQLTTCHKPIFLRHHYYLCFALVNHQQKHPTAPQGLFKKGGLIASRNHFTIVWTLLMAIWNLARKPIEKNGISLKSHNFQYVRFFLHHSRYSYLYSRISEDHSTVGSFFWGYQHKTKKTNIHAMNQRHWGSSTVVNRWSCPKAAVSSQGVVVYLKATLQALPSLVKLPVSSKFGPEKTYVANLC